MSDLTTLDNRLDVEKATCRIVIETPKGSRNKFAYDPDSNLFALHGLLPEGMAFPFDFGFVPGTRGDDGDPLDIMLLMDAPANVGCLVEVRLIGIICAEQTQNGQTESNDRLLGVAIHSYNHEGIHNIADVNKTLLDQVEEFFISYNKQRGKKFKVTGQGGPKKAVKCVKAGVDAFQDAQGKKGNSPKSK
jgi:inorganic pyrophosphatase